MGLEPILCVNVCAPIHIMQFDANVDADVDANGHANVTCKQSFNGDSHTNVKNGRTQVL